MENPIPLPKFAHGKWFWIVAGAGVAAGFVLANSPSNTGIYANKLVGQTAANLWSWGNNLAKPAAQATA